MFLTHAKHHAKHHDSPQIRHNFTTIYHPKTQKNPQDPLKNYLFNLPKFFLPSRPQKLGETCSYP